MSTDYQTVINGLKTKIETIISKYEQVAADNRKLSQELIIYKAEEKIGRASWWVRVYI